MPVGDRFGELPSSTGRRAMAAVLKKRSFADNAEKSLSCESGHSRVAPGDHDTIEAERLHPKAAYSRCRP